MLSNQDLGNILALIGNANIKGKDAITIAGIQQKILLMMKQSAPKGNNKKPEAGKEKAEKEEVEK